MKFPIGLIFAVMLCLSSNEGISQSKEVDSLSLGYPKALVSFSDFKDLMDKVEPYRAERLISLDLFLKMSEDPNTIILDTRSRDRFLSKHVKGAINLPFTEFTQINLDVLIRDKNKRILIYCNNNFDGDQINFASKTAPQISKKTSRKNARKKARKKARKNARKNAMETSKFAPYRKPIMLALNIPTFLNLYAYGYKNVYELNELVNVKDKRIKFEGEGKLL